MAASAAQHVWDLHNSPRLLAKRQQQSHLKNTPIFLWCTLVCSCASEKHAIVVITARYCSKESDGDSYKNIRFAWEGSVKVKAAPIQIRLPKQLLFTSSSRQNYKLLQCHLEQKSGWLPSQGMPDDVAQLSDACQHAMRLNDLWDSSMGL